MALFLLSHGMAQPQDKGPALLLETGRHSSEVTDIAASKDGNLLATSSDDKTVRIWSASGRHIQVLRPPVGALNGNSIYSVAISPDGSMVAYLYSEQRKIGDDGRFHTVFPLEIFNRKTNKVVQKMTQLSIGRLAFSPDGKYLAWAGDSLELFRTSDWALYAKAEDRKKGEGGKQDRASADFSPDGSRIAATIGGEVIVYSIKGGDYSKSALYDARTCAKDDNGGYCQIIAATVAASKRLALEKTLRPLHGKRPFGIAYSPDGKRLAFGYFDTGSVTVVDGQKFSQSELPSTGLEVSFINAPKSMLALAWTSDSKFLYSAGTMGSAFIKPTVIRKWTLGIAPTFEDFDTNKDRPLAVPRMVSTLAGVVFISNDMIGFLENGHSRLLAPLAGLRRQLAPELTPSGETVYFSFQAPGSILGDLFKFDALHRQISPESQSQPLPPASYPVREAVGMENAGLRSDAPVLNGVRLEIDGRSSSYAFSADGQTLLIGTSGAIYRFDRTGAQLWRVIVPAQVGGLNASRDGRFVVAALHDGTIRWYRLLDGKELLAFYVLNDRRSWVLWTPANYFDASESGIALLAMARLGDNGMIEAEPISFRSPQRRPDKINEALSRVGIIGEAEAIPSKP